MPRKKQNMNLKKHDCTACLDYVVKFEFRISMGLNIRDNLYFRQRDVVMATGGGDRSFGPTMLAYFGCTIGAYSPVTRTESNDGQITLTGAEKSIALDFFGLENLIPYRGNDEVLAAAGLDARRPFRKFPTEDIVYPKVKYPKMRGTELRLYFNQDEFKVSVGHFWGIFVKDNEIWICQFSPWVMEDIFHGLIADTSNGSALEPDQDDYQLLINENAPAMTTSSTTSWRRNPAIAAKALESCGYKCEVRPDLEIFLSKKAGKPYLEAHHFIPMKAQSVFTNVNLDTIENICILSPFIHRKLHHAPFDAIIHDLKALLTPRQALLERLEITEDYIFEIYQAS